MSTSLLYHTQNIRDYQYISTQYSKGCIIWNIISKAFRCNDCSSPKVSVSLLRERLINAGKIGSKHLLLNVSVHKMYCLDCKKTSTEKISFLSSPKTRITRSLERTIVELRSEMSISSISEYFELDWKTVKDCEKKYLKKKFKHIPLKHVKTIGIDELYVKTQGNEKYITIVRDLESGSVLYVGNGKGIESLASFTLRLKRSKAVITTVAMDMSKAYVSWVKDKLPNATIVFDHFHVIKLMNEKLDKVRRRTALELDEEHRKLLKNQRFLFLRNVENLEPDAKQLLDNLRKVFKELGDVSMMKEALRSIYQMAKNECQAEAAFKNWCSIARQTEIKELADMAKTIENHLSGIVAYWKTDALSNAGMEGFNNKVRWLIRQAYGFRDKEYFILKIYNLPNTKTEADL
jgi:transposase